MKNNILIGIGIVINVVAWGIFVNTGEHEIEMIMDNAKKVGAKKEKNTYFPDGSSYQTSLDFFLDDDSFVRIACLDFSKKDSQSRDRLSILLGTKEYSAWVNSKDKK